jgi:hypothetical protein
VGEASSDVAAREGRPQSPGVSIVGLIAGEPMVPPRTHASDDDAVAEVGSGMNDGEPHRDDDARLESKERS